MPNRIIKDSIHESEDVNKMTDFQFRLWVNLIAYVDDYGRGDARPAIIKGKCFPLRDIPLQKIESALAELSDIGVIRLYESDGKPLLFFPKWEAHQRVRQRVSKYPAPTSCGELRQSAASCGELRPESNPIQSKIESESEVESESNPKRKREDLDVLDRFCVSESVKSALTDFANMRKQMKSPMSERAMCLLINKLRELSMDEETQIAIVNQSILNGWKSVYPLDRRRAKAENTSNIFLQIAEEEHGPG